jgi:hypothetical protein
MHPRCCSTHSKSSRAGNYYCVVPRYNFSAARRQDVPLHWSVTARQSASRHISHVPRLSATVPTVGNAIEALTDLCDEIVETLKQMAVINAELDARDHVQVENIRRVG